MESKAEGMLAVVSRPLEKHVMDICDLHRNGRIWFHLWWQELDTWDERKCHLSSANRHQRALGENPVCGRITAICLGGTPVPVVIIKVLCPSDSSWWQVVNKSFNEMRRYLLMKLSGSFSNWEINIRAGRISSLKEVMANESVL